MGVCIRRAERGLHHLRLGSPRCAGSLLADGGTKAIRLPARSPDLNGHAERWVRGLRQESLDRVTALNEAHLPNTSSDEFRHTRASQFIGDAANGLLLKA
jgi:hypothetical protein